MFGRKKTKKSGERESLFKKEVYIPKKRLQKKERTVPLHPGKKRASDNRVPQKSVGRRVLVGALWIFFVGEVGYVLLFAGFFAITTLEIERVGSMHLANTQIEHSVSASYQGKWYGVVPKSNLLLFPSSQVEKWLQIRYPKLSAVHITKHFPHTLKVTLTEKPYQILWCSKADCFLVNKEGVTEDASVFFQYPEEQGAILRIQDQAEVLVQRGSKVLESEDQQFVDDLASSFTLRTGLIVESSLERPSVYAREIRVRTNKGFWLFFHTRLPLQESLDTLMLVLEKEIPESEWDKIDYIDLRTENRIYYTRKDRAPEKTEAQKQREEEERKRKEEEEKNIQ